MFITVFQCLYRRPKNMFVTATAVNFALHHVAVFYILGSSQRSPCTPKIHMIRQNPYCLAVHLHKEPHKHDNHIIDVEHWQRCITQHTEHNFVCVYSLW